MQSDSLIERYTNAYKAQHNQHMLSTVAVPVKPSERQHFTENIAPDSQRHTHTECDMHVQPVIN
jgi:hypothetical protein